VATRLGGIFDFDVKSERLVEVLLEMRKRSQIRPYVLDQSRIKDLRTGVATGNTQAVLDGDLDQFIEASLKSGL
jgi:protein subunit release factor B